MIFIKATTQNRFRKLISLCLALLTTVSICLSQIVMVSAAQNDITSVTSVAVPGDFTPRTTAPRNNSYYSSSKNEFYRCGYGMPNCTAYAWGRAYEILGTKPKLCTSSAYKWYNYNKDNGYYPYGKTPRLGAIICWSKGHVGVVEKIIGDTVTISESHHSGTYFDIKNLTKGKENNYIGGFQGYIYIK